MSDVPYGSCHCGCGGKTNIAPKTNAARGHIKGEPYKFLPNHHLRLARGPDYVVDANGCWIWRKRINGHGYGDCSRDGFSMAHRWYYERYVGPIPDGFQVDHLCRVRACVNPEHLEAVTPSQNVRRSSISKLTEAQVLQIRSASGTQTQIAKDFGVSQALVWKIMRREIWRVVESNGEQAA